MRHIFTLVISCLLVLSQTALAETVSDPNGASLHLAPGWTQGEAAEGATLVLFAPNPSPQFRPNINLLVQETGEMTADEYRKLSDQQATQMGGRTESYREITLDDGSTAHSLLIHFPYQDLQLTSLSVWVMREGKTYLITGTAEASDFPQRESSFTDVAMSFHLKKPAQREEEGGPLGFFSKLSI